MIQIVTKEGISLDLVVDAEFEIEYENPIVSDTRMPVPFSTSIALPPTATNCTVLKWIPAMKLEPVVRELSVSLILGGVPFISGTLIFDGIEDGNADYSFSGRDIEQEWSQKIYELNIGEFTLDESGVLRVRNNGVTGVCAPLLVNSDYAGYFEKAYDQIDTQWKYDDKLPVAEHRVKWHNARSENFPFEKADRFTPAVAVRSILGDRMNIDSSITILGGGIEALYIIGQYCHTEEMVAGSFTGGETRYASEFLPDFTMAEFIQQIGNMYCAAVYTDGNLLRFLTAGSVLGGATSIDWSSRVSDEYSSEYEAGVNYSFAFGNSGETPFDSAQLAATQADNLTALASPGIGIELVELGLTLPVKVKSTGDVLSVNTLGVTCQVTTDGETTNESTIITATDMLCQDNFKAGNTSGNCSETEDVSCDFNLVETVPVVCHYYHRGALDLTKGTFRISEGPLSTLLSMAAKIEAQSPDASRGSDAYVGLVKDNQMTSSGIYLNPSTGADKKITWDRAGRFQASLKPSLLYARFHKPYAEWVARDRQVISCDLNITPADLMNFRLYNKVRLHGRDFLVRKLTVKLTAGTDRLECSAEFIAV